MDDQLPSAEEQIPSIEEIFASLEGHPPEEQLPALAAVMQAMLSQMSEQEKRLDEYCQRVDDIYGDMYEPMKAGYQAKVRGQGIDGLKQKYGSMFDPISDALKGFGVDDVYGKLFDMLEEMKKDGSYNEADEGTYIGDQHKEAMRRIGMIRRTPPAEEVADKAPEPPAIEATVTTLEKPEEKEPPKKEEPKAPAKSLKEKKRAMAASRDSY